MKLIIDIPEEVYKTAKNTNIIQANADMLEKAITNGTPIPDNATNGNVIQALFSNIDKCFSNIIDLNLWWNAKYKGVKE